MRLSLLVGIAAVAGVSGMALLSSSGGETRIGPFEGPPLNPELYRAPIVTVDAVMFEDGPLGEHERTQLSDGLLVLGRLAAVDTTNTIAVTLGQNARMLSSMARHTRVGTPLPGSKLRQEWTRIRGSLFDDAAWFRRSSADPIAPAEPGPPPASTLRPVTAEARRNLETAIFSLGLLVNHAREDLVNAYESEAHQLYVIDTERELVIDSARVGPVPPTYGVDVFYKEARGYVLEAIEVVRLQARMGPGSAEQRERLLVKAEQYLELAKAAQAKLMR